MSKIQKNKFGKWGMAHWMEINPKGTREKIYLILNEVKKPLHFTEIAGLIDKYGLGKRKAHPQTVHNELIKDSRFVLIGRGTYVIGKWGYSQGTIREVLEDILAKSDKPMPKEEILEKVFKVRKVKKTTVMINLNNSKLFERRDNLYSVKK
jgi:DNA-directed RNA polymerase delta subunit